MSLIQGKQLANQTVTGSKLANNTVTGGQVDSSILLANGNNPLTANWAVGSKKLTGLTDPSDPQDAATKNYVDAAIQGQDVKLSCRFATTAALPANTRTGNVLTASANGPLGDLDGASTTPVLNDRILVKNEATQANNGLYFVSQVGVAGGGGTPWQLTRTTDADTSAEVTAGLFTFVEEGAANGDTGWTLIQNQPIVLNTTSLPFSQFSGAGTILAGAALLKTGNTIDLVVEGTSGGLTANADSLQVNYALSGTLAAVDAAAAAAGTSQLIARGDHKHTISTAAPGAVSVGDSAAAGSATSLARSDHQHSVAAGTPVAVGTANANGSATTFARSDHVHDSPVPATGNKNMTASVTASDGDAATATALAAANALGGYIGVFVNGIGPYLIGDGTKVGVDCYISGDGGTTARALSAVAAGDTLRWNGSVVGFQLAATDNISLLMGAF